MTASCVHKVVIQSDIDANTVARLQHYLFANPVTLHAGGQVYQIPQHSVGRLIDDVLAVARLEAYDAAKSHLSEWNRDADLLNAYISFDQARWQFSTTYVFADPDTAMLFKLSQA